MLLLLSALALADEPAPLRFTLDSGLSVAVEPRPYSDSVAVAAMIRVGARDERPETSGCAHMLEHMLFTGTERWTEAELKDLIDRRGGEWNGYTNHERTLYFVHTAAEELPLALEWIAQVVFHPTLEAGPLEKERAVVAQERGGSRGWLVNTATAWGFGYELDLAVRRLIFPGSGLDSRVIGEDESLRALDLRTLRDFYETWYVPANTALTVVGRADPEQVRALVQRHFGDLAAAPAPPAPEPPAALPPQPEPRRVVIRGPLASDQVSLRVGARTVGRSHPDHWALQVLAELLRMELTERLRYERGWTYGVQVVNVPYNDAGYFAVKTRVAGDRAEAVLAEIDASIEAAAAGAIDPERAADAARAAAGRFAIDMESNAARASDLAQWLLITPPGQPLPDYGRRVRAVSAAELRRVARTWLTGPGRYVALHRPALTARSALWITPSLGLLVAWRSYRRILRRRQKKS